MSFSSDDQLEAGGEEAESHRLHIGGHGRTPGTGDEEATNEN